MKESMDNKKRRAVIKLYVELLELGETEFVEVVCYLKKEKNPKINNFIRCVERDRKSVKTSQNA